MKHNFWQSLNKPILALAPMAGITDSAYRQICRKHGASVVYSEMASVSALFFKPAKTLDLVSFSEKERPYVVQLFGKDPKHFAKASKIITESVRPDGIDINFGCPARKVFGHGSGCALMPQKELSREIIQAVIDNTDLPVSLKIRAGVKDMTALEFIENVRDLDWKAVMVHGRTYEGSFSGPVDFSLVEKIKTLVPDRIVLANGGVMTSEDGAEILKKHPSLDGLGIARGAWGRPWIFEDIAKLLEFKNKCHPELVSGSQNNNKMLKQVQHDKSFQDIAKIALEHARLIEKAKGTKGLLEIRKHLVWYFKGFPGASELRQELVRTESLRDISRLLSDFQKSL